MSKDGYCGQGITGLYNPITLAAIIELLKDHPAAQALVENEYQRVKRELSRYLKYTKELAGGVSGR